MPNPKPNSTYSWNYLVYREIPGLTKLKEALENGLDVNSLLSEEQLMVPQPKGGCVRPQYVSNEDTWPHFNTLLQRAVKFGDFESAEYLLDQGANIDLYNSIGQTALHEALQHQHHETVKFLLEHGASVDKQTIASHARYEDRNRDISGRDGDIGLWMVLRACDTASLRLLVEAGGDLHPSAQGPWTALDLAVLAGDVSSVEVLLPTGRRLADVLQIPSSISEDDFTEAARQLLLITKSKTLVPPRDLYDVYCKARSKMKHTAYDSDLESAEIYSTIDAFFDALHGIAGERRVSNDSKCAACRQFERRMSNLFITREKFRMQIHADRQELEDCARDGCDLCGLLADALDFRNKSHVYHLPESSLETSSAVFLAPEVHGTPQDIWYSAIYIQCEEIFNEIRVSKRHERINPRLNSLAEDDLDTGSRTAMRIARNWITTCDGAESHSACQKVMRQHDTPQEMPFRLISLSESGDSIRLVEGSTIRAPYCALSYCWGIEPFHMTTSKTADRHKHEIPYELLPRMFKDAIDVTRKLGYRYLWIDALCIVQDDAADWAKEAARMHIIYSHAALTISTLNAENAHTSLFQPRKSRISHSVPLDIRLPKIQMLDGQLEMAMPGWHLADPPVRGPVHTRAWTLQEQLLSPRTLYFADGLMHWECLSKYVIESDSENCVDGVDRHETLVKLKRDLHLALNVEINDSAKTRPANFAFTSWKTQLELFSRRNITNTSDRLPAFFSISNRLAEIEDNEFVCGIWRGSRLLESLCWRVAKHKEVNESPAYLSISSVVPSWSWAHIETALSFDLSPGKPDAIRPLCDVLDLVAGAHTTLSEPTGSITMKGTLRKLERASVVMPDFLDLAELVEEAHHDAFWDQYWELETPQWDTVCFFDHRNEPVESCFAFELLIFPQGQPPESSGYGYPAFPWGKRASRAVLLLEPAGDEPFTFRRIGIASFQEDGDCRLIKEIFVGGKQPDRFLKLSPEVLLDQVITIV